MSQGSSHRRSLPARLLGASTVGIAWLVVTGAIGAVLAAGTLAFLINRAGDDLPDHRGLADYVPPTVTRIHAGDGRLLAEYAREKRVFVPIDAIPARVKQAFVAAEDKSFYTHLGLDPLGIARAAVENIERMRKGCARRVPRPSPNRSPRTSS